MNAQKSSRIAIVRLLDIGKLPDQNIAEAIQRIPGVTISRDNGEGQFITVRGLGPAFSTALYNGRILATENQGREFSFDILPAELINRVDVSKTPTAAQIEGGIAAI
jgi:TonB-dependent receptor